MGGSPILLVEWMMATFSMAVNCGRDTFKRGAKARWENKQVPAEPQTSVNPAQQPAEPQRG